jgi:hypothetical protein
LASSQTVRNNLFDLSDSRGHAGIYVNYSDPVGSSNVNIYHNTFTSNDTAVGAAGDFVGVFVEPYPTHISNIAIKNNLAFAPNDDNHLMVGDSSSIATVANNSTSLQVCNGDNAGAKNPGHNCTLSYIAPVTVWPPIAVDVYANPQDYTRAATNWTLKGASLGVGAADGAVPVWSDFLTATRIGVSSDIGAIHH